MTASLIHNQKSAIKNPLWIMVFILLLAAAFRFVAVDAAPPGWRDDELIEFNMDRRIADGWRPLFITEAEGHEPVYHYIHAGTILLFGDNIVGYKWLPLAFGLLTIALTYALTKKMFGVKVALLAAALMAVSFWPVMYSRFGVRHVGVLPWMLGAFYLLYPAPSLEKQGRGGVGAFAKIFLAGIFLAAALMTYFAGRALPLILIGFLIYLLLFNRTVLRRVWWRTLLAIGIAALIALPMFVEISRTPGGEKRTEVVGGPLIELRKGNVQPAIETTLGTLGMFTFAGDPEWLYNVENRPVFDWITGLFFYLGVLLCLIRLKRVESGFALVWLIVGIAPAFVSIPAASFSHTIAALPVVYLLAAFGVIEASVLIGKLIERWRDRGTGGQRDRGTGGQRDGGTGGQRDGEKSRLSPSLLLAVSLSFLLVILGGWLTIRDYFGTWAHEYIVRFQYHAPTREVAQWLDQHPEITDVAIGTNPYQLVLDPLALTLDLKRTDLSARWFNPEAAVVFPTTKFPAKSAIILTPMQAPGKNTADVLEQETQFLEKPVSSDVVNVYLVKRDHSVREINPLGVFDGWIGNLGDSWQEPLSVDAALSKWTGWQILRLPPVIQLKSFVHLLDANNQVISGEDRADFNFATLLPGDVIRHMATLNLPAPTAYSIEVGWYYPDTGRRLILPDGKDSYLLPNKIEVIAP